MIRRSFLATALCAAAAPALGHEMPSIPPLPALAPFINDPKRPAADRARDKFRHPLESLTFWGVTASWPIYRHPVILDLQPGGGYWTEILAPYLRSFGGFYIAGVADLDDPKLSEGARRGRALFEAAHSDEARYGKIIYAGFGPRSDRLAPPGTVSMILSSREIHDWLPAGYADKAMADCFAALQTGGIFAVEDHRADPRPEKPGWPDGYVNTSTVVAAAKKAGFTLAASSEINANPKDTKDHPFGVWTLPPSRQSAPNGQPANPDFDHSNYDAIGESDRMTLRFIKPLR
jgi:predicted methyltransferase